MMYDDLTCPECGSDDLTEYINADEYNCNECGHGWGNY